MLQTRLIFLFPVLLSVSSGENIAYYNGLPSVYGMDNLVECHKHGYVFCEAKIRLKPKQPDSEVWKNILESKRLKYTLDRSELFRAICVQHGNPNEEQIITDQITSRFNSELYNRSLEVDHVRLYICTAEETQVFDSFQKMFILLLVLNAIIIIAATIYDLKDGKNEIIRSFSLIHNQAQLTKVNSNPNYQRLKFIQGLRTYNTIMVIGAHTVVAFFLAYTTNPEFLEILARGPVQWFFTLGMFIVQPFFVITGWLMMYFILQHIEKEGEFTIRDVLNVIMFRVLRLWPCLILAIMLEYSGILFHMFKSSHQLLVKNDLQNCKKRWWMSLFFLTNFASERDACCIHTWYLAADFQICVCCLLVILFIYRFKLPIIRSLLIFFAIVVSIFMMQLYKNNLNAVMRIEPKQLQMYSIWDRPSKQASIWYLSSLSNLPSFIIGLIFGTIHYRRKDLKYFDNAFMKTFWGISLIGFAGGAVFLAGYDYEGLTAAFLGSLLKAMFSLGIAIGILGLSEGTEGVITRILEWRFAEILSNLTYCVYLTHVLFAVGPLLITTKPEEIYWSKMIFLSATSVVVSFIAGYLCTLTVELPWKNLTNLMFGRKKMKQT